MKRIGTLALAGMMAVAFGTATLTSVSAEAKSHHSTDTQRKKKKKKKKHHQAASLAKSEAGATTASREPASTGYQRASVYMAKHKSKSSTKKKRKHS